MKTIYRHYGNDHFDNTLVKPIKNHDAWGKPCKKNCPKRDECCMKE